LKGHPFGVGLAQSIFERLTILQKLKNSFDSQGQRTPEWNQAHDTYFKGENAWFSDSSATEKDDFRSKLTFRHPTERDRYLFCSWHGKIKSSQLRIHFSYPIRAEKPLYVMYIGPKITKR